MRAKLIVLSCLALLSPAAVAAGDATVSERVDALLAPFGDDTPGVAVGVVRDGRLVFTRSAGMADLGFSVPFTVGTPTNIGSTAKQFTGFALALLHQRGELSLDDDIRRYLPDLPDFGTPVTLRHLASHTSGYREFLNALALAGRRIEKGDWIDADEAIELARRQPELQNPPGGEWNYNNTGYLMLAMVIEQVTGRPFDEWVTQEILHPLGMRATVFRTTPDVIIRGGTTGYVKADDGFREARDVGGALGAGSVYTTIGDMARWMQHLGRFELGGAEVRTLMTTPFVLNDGGATKYGLGLIIDEWRGLQRWQHGGGDIGHLAAFHYYPELDAGLMVFANHHDIGAGFTAALAEIFFSEQLAPAAAEQAPPADEDAPFDDALFDRYAGRYELEAAPGFVLRFFRDGARYMSQATGQPAMEITPLSASSFQVAGVNARVSFEADEQGRITALTLHQNGAHRAARLPDDELPPAPDFSEFAGRYFSAELETYYAIELAQGQLQLRHRRFGPVALHQVEGDAFRGGFPVFSVDFERDDDGVVTGLRAGNVRARDIVFRRVD